MESEDYEFYKGLVFLMEHEVSELGYELTFSTDVSLETRYRDYHLHAVINTYGYREDFDSLVIYISKK